MLYFVFAMLYKIMFYFITAYISNITLKRSVLFHVGMLQIALKHTIQNSRTSNANKEIKHCEKNHFNYIMLDIYSTASTLLFI